MNDSNNNDSADNQQGTAGTQEARLSRPNRNSDIYQRFLKRVQQIEGDSSQDKKNDSNDNQAPTDVFARDGGYEPLTEEELRLFADFEQQEREEQQAHTDHHTDDVADDESLELDNSLDDSEDSSEDNQASESAAPAADATMSDETDETDTDVAQDSEVDAPAVPNTVAKPKTSKQGGMKLLIIGLVCGCLIGAAAFFVLMPADKGSSNGTSETATGNSGTEESNATAAGGDAVTGSANVQQPASNSTTTQGDDPDLTYEDFREESKTTLYRDTSK